MIRSLTTTEAAEMDDIRERLIALVGPLSDEEVANVFGRRSRTRAMAIALGCGPHLPPLPPIDKDMSLLNAARYPGRPRRRHGERRKPRLGEKPC